MKVMDGVDGIRREGWDGVRDRRDGMNRREWMEAWGRMRWREG